MINWAKLPVGKSFQAHYHEDMEEVFVIIHGAARMTVAGQDVVMGPGDTVCVAPREVHHMTNVGQDEVDYLVVGISTGQDGKTVVVPSP